MNLKRIITIAVAVLLLFSSILPVSALDVDDTITLFSDVSLDYWAFEPIYKLVSAEVLTGYPEGTFEPLAKITRAEIAAMLCRGFDVEPVEATSKFTDTGVAAWAEKYINPLSDQGIFLGVGENLFDPTANITNAEVAKLMVRLINRFNPSATYSNPILTFSDEQEIATWAKDSAKEAVAYGVMDVDSNNKFNPKEVVTRDKLADTILKTMQTIYNKEYGIKTIIEKTYGDWVMLEPIIQDKMDYCDKITKRCIVGYPCTNILYNPIENNPNAKYSTWYPSIPLVRRDLREELAKNKKVYNEKNELIIKLEEKDGENGPLYRTLEDEYRLYKYVYEVREKNVEKIIYPGTI